MDVSKTQREIVLDAKQRRPNDWWPRGDGHVLLGNPGEPTRQKGYHEPGGSFSPAPGSFGVALWVLDAAGRIQATSDTIAIEQIEQHYAWSAESCVPSLVTRTPFYGCTWSMVQSGQWQLTVEPIARGMTLQVVIRSVGPAGGPLENLSWDGAQLQLNRRWVVQGGAAPAAVCLGSEEESGWVQALPARTAHADGDGWCVARLLLAAGTGSYTLTIRDTVPQFSSPLACAQAKSGLEMDLPDPRFMASLDAQAAHLLMGFEGNQTRPGEPVNYPLAWERDGAYAVIAMARCGQTEVARELSVYFAENDFFGGFGPEADAPGSAINVLVEVANILQDPAYTAWAWKHVARKVALIEEMLAAKQQITKEWIGPIVPCHLTKPIIPVLCEAARDNLINGTMDLHFPLLYINATAYRGLRQAAKLATELGHSAEARRLEEIAVRVQGAWRACFQTDEVKNPRTYISSLWPNWIAAGTREQFQAAQEKAWQNDHDANGVPLKRPLWTYFNTAQAHQWLFLGDIRRVWQTLSYFWDNDCSPGLYAYWEGHGEENSFRQWESIRGWLAPRYVTPHYWTAAEMLLLQLDMLACVTEFDATPVLVIGAGVPAGWTQHPMRVQGVPTSAGKVSWTYKDKQVVVEVTGPVQPAVRLGSGFAKDTRVEVRHLRMPTRKQ